MRKALRIFRIFGIDIQLHYSWWFVFALLAWSLSSAFFPQFFPGETSQTYWTLGIISTLLLFVSVLLHELSHSLVAKARRIPVETITLFFFGGVAGITKEDMKPSSEFMMALAGPAFSLLLSAVFFFVYIQNINLYWTAISYYLYQLNLILAVFNLVPGYPLDGGRAFRALLHGYFKDLRKATRIASTLGRVFAGFLVVVGIYGLFTGVGGGLWFIFLGGFLYFIAGMSYQQVVLKEVLGLVSVKDILDTHLTKVKASMKFSDFVKKYAKSGKHIFLVKDKDFIGILDVSSLKKMRPEVQERLTVKQVSLPVHDVRSIKIDDTGYTAFRKMSEQGLELLPVIKKGKVVGLLSRNQLVNRLLFETKFSVSSMKAIVKKRKKRTKRSTKRKKK